MFSLQKLLGREDRFFTLLVQAAGEAHHSAVELRKMIWQPGGEHGPRAVALARGKEKEVHEAISELLCKTFIIPFDREDIEAVSMALHRVPKTLGKFTDRLALLPEPLAGMAFSSQTDLIEQSTAIVLEMVRLLPNPHSLERMRALYGQLQALENQADREILLLQHKLHREASSLEVMNILMLNDLHKLLERTMDRCRDAGKAVFQVVLKHT